MADFDQKAYVKQYQKDNYKQISFRCNAADIAFIKEFAKSRNMSIPVAIVSCMQYIDANNIDIRADKTANKKD